MPPPEHLPVLKGAVLEALAVRPNGDYADATLGLGGHAEAILEASAPAGRLLGIDADPEAVRRSAAKLACYEGRTVIVQGNFRRLGELAAANGIDALDGVLLDLGISSLQLGPQGRGFSFQHAAPLDMRMDPALERSAAEIVNQAGEQELANILRRYGEEPAARKIAHALVQRRPFTLTTEVARLVGAVAGRHRSGIHPATRTFQALRIAVNDELGSLQDGLRSALHLLRSGGRLVVISFHSLEDRIVKEFFRGESRDCICPPELPLCVCSHRASLRLPRRSAVIADAAEIAANPRSRSARLRVAERI